MRARAFIAVLTLVLPAACAGASNSPGAPMPGASSGPVRAASETIAPAGSATTAPLPSIGGIYGGQIVLPPGSGTATLTFSLDPPAGVLALTELTPSPQIAYITLTAQSAFSLSAYPGLNLSVPTTYMGIDMWLNAYGGGAWASGPIGWPSTTPSVSAVCFAPHGAAISLQAGQSFYLGINGDNVLPTPVPSGPPAVCPQAG